MRPCNARMCTRTRDARDTLALRARYARDTSSNICPRGVQLLNVLKCRRMFFVHSEKIRTFAASSTSSNTIKH